MTEFHLQVFLWGFSPFKKNSRVFFLKTSEGWGTCNPKLALILKILATIWLRVLAGSLEREYNWSYGGIGVLPKGCCYLAFWRQLHYLHFQWPGGTVAIIQLKPMVQVVAIFNTESWQLFHGDACLFLQLSDFAFVLFQFPCRLGGRPFSSCHPPTSCKVEGKWVWVLPSGHVFFWNPLLHVWF